jgi:formiminotetrahydrofolate cyclodeaminase
MTSTSLESSYPAQLIYQPVIGFVEQVAAKSAAPGGGSCAALSGATGCALLVMVARFTIAKKDLAAVAPRFTELQDQLDALRLKLLHGVDEDTAAFNRFRVALKLPERDDAERTARATELALATTETIRVPQDTMYSCLAALRVAPEIVRDGNRNTISDAATGAEMLMAGLRGAAYNVLINLPGIPVSERAHYFALVSSARLEAEQLLAEIRQVISGVFGG